VVRADPSTTPRRGSGAGKVSVKDVAAAAGVSLGTVSNVLNRPDRVAAATRARVEDAMRSMGFVRNESARQLRAGTSRSLAYVMLDAGNPFFTDVSRGIEDAALLEGLSLVLCNSSQLAEREARHLELLEQQRVQGVLVTPVDPTSPVLDALRGRGTPVVIVDRTREDESFCSVAVDDVLGGRLAAEHLLDRGHRRLAFVGGPRSLGQVQDRWDGARAACRDHEHATAVDLRAIETDSLDVAAGRAAGEVIAGLASRVRPTAAFCANDLVALGLLQQAIGSGVRVPEELAIVGYDDIEFAGAAAVPLTSVRQPRRELGEAAAALLLEEAGGGRHEHRQIVFTPQLVARRSST